MKQTSIVICTFNRPNELRLLLDTIERQTVKPVAVYVIDQSKGDLIAQAVKDFIAALQPSFACHNLKVSFQGLTKARNYGLAQVQTELTSFIDDDVTLGPTYLEEILKFFESQNPILVGGIPQFPDVAHKGTPLPGGFWFWYRKVFSLSRPSHHWKVLPNFEAVYRLPLDGPTRADYFSGSNFTISTQAAKAVGFDEKLIWYSIGEDIDFPIRVRKTFGEQVWLTPHPPVFHPLPPTQALSEFLLRVHVLHHYYLFFKLWSGTPSVPVKLMFYWARIGNMLMPGFQRRKGLCPDFELLKRSWRVERDVFRARRKVALGDFSSCITLPRR